MLPFMYYPATFSHPYFHTVLPNRQLTNITGDQIIITDITYTVLDNGEVDTSRQEDHELLLMKEFKVLMRFLFA